MQSARLIGSRPGCLADVNAAAGAAWLAVGALREDSNLFGGGRITHAVLARAAVAEALALAASAALTQAEAGGRVLAPPAAFSVAQLCVSLPALGEAGFVAMLQAKASKILNLPPRHVSQIWLSQWEWTPTFHTQKDSYHRRCYPDGIGGANAAAAASQEAAAAAAKAAAAAQQKQGVAAAASRWAVGLFDY